MTQKNNQRVAITHEEINELPLGAFEGKVVVVSEEKNLPRVFAEINKHTIVGFDTETNNGMFINFCKDAR